MKRAGKKSMISGILALSLVLAGTGYAYWTDTLNVTSKATTGDFGVTFADLGLYAQYSNETLPKGWSIVDGIGKDGYVADDFFMRGGEYNKIAKDGSIVAYQKRAQDHNSTEFDAKLVGATPLKKTVGPYNSANTNSSDKIELTIQKMYPGYAQAFRTDILNVGDIAAKLSNMKFKVSSLDGKDIGKAKDMLGVAILMNKEQHDPTTVEGENVLKLAKTLASGNNFFKVGGVDFLRLSALENADVKTALGNNTIFISPDTDQRMDMYIGIAIDPDSNGVYTTGTTENLKVNDDAASQNKGVQVSIDLLWDQFNVGKDAKNPNILSHQNK